MRSGAEFTLRARSASSFWLPYRKAIREKALLNMEKDAHSDRDNREKPKRISDEKPPVRSVVGLLLLRGVLMIAFSIRGIVAANMLLDDPATIVSRCVLPLHAVLLLFGILDLITAVQIGRYRRSGLVLGLVVMTAEVLVASLLSVVLQGTFTIGFGFWLNLWALYVVWKYLTQHPQKTFFA